MTITIAIVNDWIVTNVIQIDDSQYQQYANSCQVAIDVTNNIIQPMIGWTFDGANLSGPPASWKITKLAFRERFTTPELMGIISASQQSNSEGLILQVMLQNQM